MKSETIRTGSPELGNEVVTILASDGKIRIMLQQKEVKHEDPGDGTPALVYLQNPRDLRPFKGDHVEIFDICLSEREVDSHKLTNAQYKWLEDHALEVDKIVTNWFGIAEEKLESKRIN